MKVEHFVYCGNPECEKRQEMSTQMYELGQLPRGWVQMKVYAANGGGQVQAFCHTDCCMYWCSTQKPAHKELAE